MIQPLPFSQACENNQAPILEKLREIMDTPGVVLEIGTLTGQHAVHFAQALSHLQWQPSDHPDSCDISRPRLEQAALPNILPPMALDVSSADWPDIAFDAVFSANTAHIMAWPEVEAMFQHIGARLPAGGVFCLYGPFNESGEYSSDSNRRFDEHLRKQAPHMGIRDLDDLIGLAESANLRLEKNHAMPANNRLLVFRSMA